MYICMCVCTVSVLLKSPVSSEVVSTVVEEVTTSEMTMEPDLMRDFIDETSALCVPVAVVESANNTPPSVSSQVTTDVPSVTITIQKITAAVPEVTCRSVQSSCTGEETLPSTSSSETLMSTAVHGSILVSSFNKQYHRKLLHRDSVNDT